MNIFKSRKYSCMRSPPSDRSYPIFAGQHHRMVLRRRYRNDRLVFVSVHQMHLLRQHQCRLVIRSQATSVAQANAVQLAFVVDIQTVVTAQTHTPHRKILLRKTVQMMWIPFPFLILQPQAVVSIIAPDQYLFELIPAEREQIEIIDFSCSCKGSDSKSYFSFTVDCMPT